MPRVEKGVDEEGSGQGFSSPVNCSEELRSYSEADGKPLGSKLSWFNVHLRQLLFLGKRGYLGMEGWVGQ